MTTISKISEHCEKCFPSFLAKVKLDYAHKYDMSIDEVCNVDALMELSLLNPRVFGVVADSYFLVEMLEKDVKLL